MNVNSLPMKSVITLVERWAKRENAKLICVSNVHMCMEVFDKKNLKCTMIGVGPAFDNIAGNKTEASKWIQFIGMEWLFRLILEPKRL